MDYLESVEQGAHEPSNLGIGSRPELARTHNISRNLLDDEQAASTLLLKDEISGVVTSYWQDIRTGTTKWQSMVEARQRFKMYHEILCTRDYGTLGRELDFVEVWTEHLDESFFAPTEGETKIYQGLVANLESRVPGAFYMFREWQRQVETLIKAVAQLEEQWVSGILERAHDEKYRFEGGALVAAVDDVNGTFATTMWKVIINNYLLSINGFSTKISDLYHLKQRGVAIYTIAYMGEDIAHGNNQWMSHLQRFHQKLIIEQQDILIEEIKRHGFLDECKKLLKMAVEGRYKLRQSGIRIERQGNRFNIWRPAELELGKAP